MQRMHCSPCSVVSFPFSPMSSAHRSLHICFTRKSTSQVEGISPVIDWMPKEGYALSTLGVSVVGKGIPKLRGLVDNLLLVAEQLLFLLV